MLPPESHAPTPWLSVITPTYNGAAYVRQALDSVVLQNDPQIEVIVIDDGSSDETLAIVREYASRLRLRIIDRGRQKSWVRNTNAALLEAAGQYVTFLHQDDFWLDGRLSVMRDLVRRFPDAVLFLHPSHFVGSAGEVLGTWNCPFPKTVQPLQSDFVFRRLIVQNFISIPAPLFKRSAALQAGMMKESLWFTADWDYWLRLSLQGSWVYWPRPLSCFRIHSGSQTIQGSPDSKDYRGQYEEVLSEFLPRLGLGDPLRRVAQFSSDVNCELARVFHGRKALPWGLIPAAVKLGPLGWYRYVAYSRIGERVGSRLRARVSSDSGVLPSAAG